MIDRPPLTGTRVLDLTRDAAGRACAGVFAGLGAEVTRGAPETISHVDRPACDLILSDLRCQELDTIDWEPQGGEAPVVSITPFGLDGPYAERDDWGLASSWLGQRAAAALTAAHAAAVGMALLMAARQSRRRLMAEIATYEAVAGCLGDTLPPAVCSLPQRGPVGSRISVARCADGFVGIAAPTPIDRVHLARLTGVPGMADSGADLAELLTDWLLPRTRLQVFEEAQLWRIPIAPLLTQDETLRSESALVPTLAQGQTEGAGAPRSPFRFGGPLSGALQPRSPDVPPPPPSPARIDGETDRRLPPFRLERGERLPLHNIRVLDLGMVWAGPYCGRLLSGLGADVIKVEGPTRRDGTRPPDDWRGCAGVYSDLNRGKRSLVIDLATEAGRDAFLRVARDIDVVLESFSPRVMPNLGLDHAALTGANPHLITLSMPAFGSDGPWGSYVAYGSGLELMAGLSRMRPDGLPKPAPVPYLDYLSGVYGAVAILAGLLARSAPAGGSGGVHVEVAQYDIALGLLADQFRCLPDDGAAFDPASLAHDPHLIARGLFPSGETPDCRHYLRPPWILHGQAPTAERSAPQFGGDSRQILSAGGIAEGEINELIETGVVVGDVSGHARSPR